MKVVTIQEVSEFLKVKKPTLYSWVNQKLIPAFKINGLWRFDMEKIEEWVKASHDGQVSFHRVRKTARNQDIDHIIKQAIEEAHGNGQHK